MYMGWELTRYLVGVAATVSVVGCVWTFERTSHFVGVAGTSGLSSAEIDRLSVARDLVLWGLALLPLAMLGWAWLAHQHTLRLGAYVTNPAVPLVLFVCNATVFLVVLAIDPHHEAWWAAALLVFEAASALVGLAQVPRLQSFFDNPQTATIGLVGHGADRLRHRTRRSGQRRERR